MRIIRHNKLSIPANRTINKLVIIRVCLNQMKEKSWCYTDRCFIVHNSINNNLCKPRTSMKGQNLIIFCKDLSRDTPGDFSLNEVTPQLMIWAIRRDAHQKTIGVYNYFPHHA